MSAENGASGFSGTSGSSAASTAESSASISAQVGTEFSSLSGISELTISRESALAIEAETASISFNEPSINNLGNSTDNPFSLPMHSINLEAISMDTTRKFPELAFNPDLYRPVIEITEKPPAEVNITSTHPQEDLVLPNIQVDLSIPAFSNAPLPVITHQPVEIPSFDEELDEKIIFAPVIPEVDAPKIPATTQEPTEETTDESALREALAKLSAMNLPEDEEGEWTEKLTKAVAETDRKVDQGPAPSLAYNLAFGETKADIKTQTRIATSEAQAQETVETQAVAKLNSEQEEETLELIDEEIATEADEEEEKREKRIIIPPEKLWDRYEIVPRNETAEDVQERRAKTAEKAVGSATNSYGQIEIDSLKAKLSELDEQTADEKVRIAEGTLDLPNIASEAAASLDTSRTQEEALSEIGKVIAQNEAINHVHEIASRQTLPFDKLDREAQEVIINLRADKVIRPLVWEKADELPLKNPVEIERSKKAA